MKHPDYPIKAHVSGDGIVATTLLGEARQCELTKADHVLASVHDGRVRLLGRSERALHASIGGLRTRVAARLHVDGPRVRYVYGARVLEPHMRLRLRGPAHAVHEARREVERRGGAILRIDPGIGATTIEATAPLARLLGYDQWLAEHVGHDVAATMRLGHYDIADGAPVR